MKRTASYVQKHFTFMPVSRSLVRRAFLRAQRRTEEAGRQMRLRTLKSDTWLDENLTFAGRSSYV